MPDVPFHLRALVLLSLLGIVAAIDWHRHREAATRWREYSALIALGLLGGVVGALLDQVSLALGPEYFELGKGIEPGDGFRLRVSYLGFQAGVVAGLVGGSVLLVANGAHGHPLPRVARFGLFPLLGALLVGALGCGLGAAGFDPLGLTEIVDGILAAHHRAERVVTVWGFHAGLYLGALLGLVAGVIQLRRGLPRPPADPAARPTPAPGDAPPRSDPPETDR